ncbi:hypothetical protein C6P41_002340 [Kluyveromyces marxianus]|nr:hypothetical protein C6P43_000304 [Kluyveromyces marxianus]KAG0684370.1 hypothetical protein C6P41_002340 [Kluyveromyces marxianus]
MNGRSPLKKRNVLSSKNVNVNATGHAKLVSKPGISGSRGSPVRSRTKIDVEQALQSSPVRQVRSMSPIKCGSGASTGTTTTTFTFYEESEEDRAAALVRHMTLRRSAVHDENETEQENQNQKLEPSRVHTQTQKHRKPLQDLDIDKYPGTVQYAGGREQRLTLQLGHQRALPVGVTPPRDKKVRDFFGGKQGGAGEAATPSSSTTDDIPLNKVVRKLDFRIAEV